MTDVFALVTAAVAKHKVAGIAGIVLGAVIALFGVVRAVQRLTGAALTLLIGVVIVVLGVLVYTHTIY